MSRPPPWLQARWILYECNGWLVSASAEECVVSEKHFTLLFNEHTTSGPPQRQYMWLSSKIAYFFGKFGHLTRSALTQPVGQPNLCPALLSTGGISCCTLGGLLDEKWPVQKWLKQSISHLECRLIETCVRWRSRSAITSSTSQSACSKVLKFTKFYWLTVSGGPRRITIPNFVKIGRSVAEILRFFEFSRWPPPPSWIFKIAKFYWLFGSRVWWIVLCQQFYVSCFINLPIPLFRQLFYRQHLLLYSPWWCCFVEDELIVTDCCQRCVLLMQTWNWDTRILDWSDQDHSGTR